MAALRLERIWRRLGAMLAGVGVCLAGVTPARGAEPVRFSWVRGEGAESCAAEPQIAGRVTARLGASPFSAGAARSIEALVARAERGFRVVIYVRGADGVLVGSREIASEASDCASIEAASVLAIALAIDPDAETRGAPITGSGIAERSVAPSPSPSVSPSSSGVPAAGGGSGSPAGGGFSGAGAGGGAGAVGSGGVPPVGAGGAISGGLGPFGAPLAGSVVGPGMPLSGRVKVDPRGVGVTLRGGAGFGLLPQVSPVLDMAGHVTVAERFRIAAEVMWLPEARTADRGFAFGLTAFSLGVCGVIAEQRAVELSACAMVWAGSLHAVVYDLAPKAPGDFAWAGASAVPELRIKMSSHVYFEFGAHVLVPFVRRSFSVIGATEPVFQQPPVTVVPFGGLGVHFP